MTGNIEGIQIEARVGGVEMTVKVVPGAARTKVVGGWGTALKVAVSAPPEGGRANAAVRKLLASVLGVKKADITIVRGLTQPVKRVTASGLTVAQARERLAQV
ncbi:MAG: DUF167 domain-containing protein [Phycisphaerae bacterium]|nr:DUF167 domain-containing protein [Phycisphaerae bacterium]